MQRHLRTLLIVGLAVGLMAFFLRNADLGRVWNEIRHAHWGLLTASLVLANLAYLVRVERWRHLLAPIRWPGFINASRATVMGFAANSLMPGRVGEVLRPYVLARHEQVSASAALATIVLERLLDLLSVVLIFSWFVVVVDPAMPAAGAGLLATIQTGAAVAGVGAIAAFGVVFAVAGDPGRAGRFLTRITRAAPGGVMHKLVVLVHRFLEGFAVIRRVRPLVVALAWSLPLWSLVAVSIWCATTAFGMDIPWTGGFILLLFVVGGVAVPTPAGVGGYHAAYQLGASALYGASVEQAVGAAVVLHLAAFGPITICGLLWMAHDGLRLTRLGDLADASRSQSAAPVDDDTGADMPEPSVLPVPDDEGSRS